MKILKSFCIAFSMFSRIPMPQFEWREEDMAYSLCFFPFVGAVIGALIYFIGRVLLQRNPESLSYAFLIAAIPILISGGIHIDGFMDTEDAFHSYQSKERKLEILKDPHIGSFAVIRLLLYYLLYLWAIQEIRNATGLFLLALSFPLSRCMSALNLLYLPKAKKTGSLNSFYDAANKRSVTVVLLLQLSLYFSLMLWISPFHGLFLMLLSLLCLLYYYKKTKRELGGITGDTAGWFVTFTEIVFGIFIAILNFLG